MLTVLNGYASDRIDCDENPDHPFCTGEEGLHGGPFCDDPSNPESCYDRNDNPESYCSTQIQPTSNFCDSIEPLCDEDGSIKPDDPLCTGEEGRDGLIFCDLQEEDSLASCYDRED